MTDVLRPRLQALLDTVPAGVSVADIGCDHGQLSAALARKGCRVIACDISAPSLEKARRLCAQQGLPVQTRLSDGFDALLPGEVQAAVLAGMGGALIAGILRRADLTAVDMLVLMPHSEVFRVYEALGEKGFAPVQENVLWDAGRPYRLLVARPGTLPPPQDVFEKHFGPLLPVQRPAGLAPLLQAEIEKKEYAAAAQQKAGRQVPEEDMIYLRRCREVLQCMQD